jgi:hypothetical protein
MTLNKATDLGEQFEGFELHSNRIKGGTAYWVVEQVDNTRTTYNEYTIRIIFDDGETVDIDHADEQEFQLWTTHLK